MKVTKKTKLAKLLDDKIAQKVLAKYDFPCLSCSHARSEMEALELGTVCEMYDLDIDKIIKDLNEKLDKK
jgi:hypothetical protein